MQHIELVDLSKRYDETLALRRANVSAKAGEIVAICGENGAGKSTLMSLLAGSRQPTAGEIRIDGKAVTIASPHDAFDLGIRTVYQELSLLPSVSVAENLYLGEMPVTRFGLIDWPRVNAEAKAHLADLGLDEIDVTRATGSYPVAIQQMFEIAKAIQFNPKLLILDEPTGVLTQAETDLLFAQMERLSASGTIIFYISHRLDEVLQICDSFVVLKDGETVDRISRPDATKERLVHAMVGRSLDRVFPPRGATKPGVLMQVDDLQAKGVHGVSFTLAPGEILGFGGLVGSGRTETMRAIFGADPRAAGSITVDGSPLLGGRPKDAMAAGIGMVTEERKQDGLALDADILDNAGLASMGRFMRGPFLDGPARRSAATDKVRELDIRPRNLPQLLRQMSGGNQQKVILAKWLLMENLKVLILDEPTRGVDIGTKVAIYQLIAGLAAEGLGIVLVSSEMPEILGLAHRILIMRDGRVAGELPAAAATEHKIFHLASHDEPEAAA